MTVWRKRVRWATTWQIQQNECGPAKTQISLGIRSVWSESSLSAWRNLGSLATHWAHSEDSDQVWPIPRLNWVFAGCTVTLGFSNVAAHLLFYLKPVSLMFFSNLRTTYVRTEVWWRTGSNMLAGRRVRKKFRGVDWVTKLVCFCYYGNNIIQIINVLGWNTLANLKNNFVSPNLTFMKKSRVSR